MEKSLIEALECAESIDIATAFFYFSGFRQLATALKDKKMRILVGMTIDPRCVDQITNATQNGRVANIPLSPYTDREYYARSNSEKYHQFVDSFIALFNRSSLSSEFDDMEAQNAQKIFEEKLHDGSLEIRMCGTFDDHSKVYIIKNDTNHVSDKGKGVVFMGSSNMTYEGLIGNKELNEKFNSDEKYDEYSKMFEEKWSNSECVDIATAGDESFLREIERRIWLHAVPKPYEIYARILYEMYDKENREDDILTPESISDGRFSNFKYQLDAIRGGLECLEKNNGVIIADVVGLGKSIIASTIAKNLGMRAIVIVPPHLKSQWEDYRYDFNFNADIESSGMIESVYNKYINRTEPVLYIIDEAHRYRNELTDDYQRLHQLTRSNAGNKVVLLTATPYNNKPQDLFAMIKLFQTPSRSTINTVDNLSMRFHELIIKYNKVYKTGKNNITQEIRQELDNISAEIRRMIEPVVIRRSRLDLMQIKEYREDLERQNITFPEVVGPRLIDYELGELRDSYISTLRILTNSRSEDEDGYVGARYQPTAYLVEDKIDEFHQKYDRFFNETDIKTAQTNLADFMKKLLVQRFESSKYAFRSTLSNIIRSNDAIIKWWYDKGYVPILKKGIINDPSDFDDGRIEEVLEAIAKGEDIDEDEVRKIAIPIPSTFFSNDFIKLVESDNEILENIRRDWFPDGQLGTDPKSEQLKDTIYELLEQDSSRKIVIFSTYADTVESLYNTLTKSNFRCISYSGSATSKKLKETVSANFDASYPEDKQEDDYDIIIATDALSEGFNLNRAGVVINYDIPYNPTRVVQRIGRINRINRRMFEKIYIYNFFPTSVGDEIVNIKGIATLKMLLINSIVGSDTRTLTPDEQLETYFKSSFDEADSGSREISWDNDYRNDYNGIKDNEELRASVMKIPERTRIVRRNASSRNCIAFAKRGDSLLFAISTGESEVGHIRPPEDVLPLFKADMHEASESGDEKLDVKFRAVRDVIIAPHPLPPLQGNRQKAVDILQYLIKEAHRNKNELKDLLDIIREYDDLSDGELKFIAELDLDEPIDKIIDRIVDKFPTNVINSVKEKANMIGRVSEIVMYTEDLRNE
ncbi:MAG: helicase-related protein [Candidatus Saccharibacteria bacterium]|nr:helicase-related protein [Candidatus Saccharibacteria bacterium]